ncbi:MAG TPA: extracellular solute-binding protein [Ruminiclostridium sp.]
MAKRLVALVLSAVMVVSLFAGCGKSGSDSATSTSTSAASSQVATEVKKPVTLEFWHANSSKEVQAYFELFNKKSPDIQINQTVYVDDDYKTQSRIALAAKTSPDVWYINTGESLKQFVDGGGMMDITPYVKEKGWDTRFDEAAQKMCSIDGKMYGLPWSLYTPWMVTWANKDFFEKNKLEYPKTVDDMIALAAPLRKLGQEPLVFYNKDGWTGAILFGEYVLQQAGTEWIDDINSGKTSWVGNKEAKVALETLAKLEKAGVFLSGYGTQRQDTALLVWKDQKSPLLYNGTWFTQVTGKELPFQVETLTMPLLTADTEPKAYQNWIDWTVGISPETKNVEQAVEFLDYAGAVEFYEILGNYEGNLTPCTAANSKVNVPYFFNKEPITKQLDKPKTQYFCYAFPLPVIESLQTQIKLVLSGDATPDEALAAIEAEHVKNRK